MSDWKWKTAAIVLAAGQGRRMHSEVAKQFLMLGGQRVVCHSLRAFENSPAEAVVLVTGEGEIEYCQKQIIEAYGFQKVVSVVTGGKERYHSVYAGLCALEGKLDPDGIVMIHDGARPLITGEIIERTIRDAEFCGASVAAMPVKDTIKVADAEGFAALTPDRSTLWQIQTPQTFSYGLVFDAYRKLLSDARCQKGITDDAMVVENMCGRKVKLTEGSYENIKVTTPEDMIVAEAFLQKRKGR